MNEESSSVPASQVRLVDMSGSIHDNPLFCDWIGSSTTQGTHSDAESDMHAQLDEQINKITMMTDSFNETSSSTTQFLADAATKTPRTRRTRRSQSSSLLEQGRRQRKEASKSGLPLDKQPRLSPLAARAALAATVLITEPLQQVKPPSSLESRVMSSHSSKYRSDSRPVRVARNAPRKCRKDLKAKEKSNRAKEKEALSINLPIFKS